MPGTTGTPARMAARRAAVLLPIVSMAAGVGPMKVRPGVLNRRRERFVLGQEPVARVDRVGARCFRRVEQAIDAQIAVARRAGANG